MTEDVRATYLAAAAAFRQTMKAENAARDAATTDLARVKADAALFYATVRHDAAVKVWLAAN